MQLASSRRGGKARVRSRIIVDWIGRGVLHETVDSIRDAITAEVIYQPVLIIGIR